MSHSRQGRAGSQGEALKLVVDLEGQLARVAQHDGADLPLLGLELVQRREHEDGRLAHTGLGLADDVHAQDGLRDALVLHLGRVLEAAVDNRAQQLGLEQEVAEARRVDAGVGAPPDSRRKGIILGRGGCDSLHRIEAPRAAGC